MSKGAAGLPCAGRPFLLWARRILGRATLALALASALPLTFLERADASPHFETVRGHRVLVVDGKPFLNLSAHLEESNRVELDTLPVEAYLDRAKDLGMTAVQATICWDAWADKRTSSSIRTNSLTFEQLTAMVTHAREIGMKINLCWEGSNVTGRVNRSPVDMYDPKRPRQDHAGTFHPLGDFVPPSNFDYIHDPARYENYILVSKQDGTIGADVPESGSNYGVFCWNWPNVLARERATLKDLAAWIAQANSASDVIVSLQVESEIREAVERGPVELTNPRCFCSLSQYLVDHPNSLPEGFDPALPTLEQFRAARPDLVARVSADEVFNQWSEQNYMRDLVKGIRESLPDLPLVLNSFGDDDPTTPETDNPGAVWHDVAGWLSTGVDIVGPDMYGFRWEVFQDHFSVPGNVLWSPEIGAQYGPHFQVFAMFGSNVAGDRETPDTGPAYNGIGYSIYSLYGDLLSMFWGLLSDGVPRSLTTPALPLDTWFSDVSGWHFNGAFYTRNSFSALSAAMGPIARFAGTDRLVGFFDRGYLDPQAKNFWGGRFPLATISVKVVDLGNVDSPARGEILMTDDWDFTLVGASYSAEIQAPPRDGEIFHAERGHWVGNVWVREGTTLPDTFVQDPESGYPTVVLSADNTTEVGPLEIGTGSKLDLQYAVRIYSASPLEPEPTPTPTPAPTPTPTPTPGPDDPQDGKGVLGPMSGGGCSGLGPQDLSGEVASGWGLVGLALSVGLFAATLGLRRKTASRTRKAAPQESRR